MADISHEYKHNRPQFLEKARLWVKKHASGERGEGVGSEEGEEEREEREGVARKRKGPVAVIGEEDREPKKSKIEI